MFLRKLLFEEFWNRKAATAAEIQARRRRRDELEEGVREGQARDRVEAGLRECDRLLAEAEAHGAGLQSELRGERRRERGTLAGEARGGEALDERLSKREEELQRLRLQSAEQGKRRQALEREARGLKEEIEAALGAILGKAVDLPQGASETQSQEPRESPPVQGFGQSSTSKARKEAPEPEKKKKAPREKRKRRRKKQKRGKGDRKEPKKKSEGLEDEDEEGIFVKCKLCRIF